MVFPYTDYVVKVTASGYTDFISPTISVEEDIVQFDVSFDPNPVRDLAVRINEEAVIKSNFLPDQ